MAGTHWRTRRDRYVVSVFVFEDFRFDPATGELTRGDRREILPPQVAGALQLLVEHAGDVVSRDDFRRKLWPDTTVDFDQGLNFCIRQLRIALADDADKPVYVETLPRRGYRFRAHVTRTSAARRSRTPVLVGLLAVIVIASGAALVRARGPHSRVIAIVPFDLDTLTRSPEDEQFRDGLVEAILERTTNRGASGTAIVGPALTAGFHSRTPIDSLRAHIGAAYALSGAVHRRGGALEVFAQLVRAEDRGHVWVLRMTDSTHAYAAIGHAIADSLMAIVNAPQRPRAALGYDGQHRRR